MSERNEDDVPASGPRQQPLPPLDGAEEISETELDDIAGGGVCFMTTHCLITGGD